MKCTVGKHIDIFKSHLCTTQTQAQWGIWQTQIWESGHQPLLLLRSALELPGQRFPLSFLCAVRENLQCGNMSGSAVGICLAVDLCPSTAVSQWCPPVHHWWGREGGTSVLACGKRWGGLMDLGKIHVTAQAGMQWETIGSCTRQWMVGGTHFSNLVHVHARRWPLLSQLVLAR